MTLKKIRGGFVRGIPMVAALLIALTAFTPSAHAVYSIPADRAVTWAGNAGVAGGIPNRTTICATVSPSGNDQSAIQTAINNCPAGQVVKLTAGTYNIGSGVRIKSGVTLRGAGMGSTVLNGTVAFNSGYSWDLSAAPSLNLTGGVTKGSTTITTASPHGWSPGDLVLIDQYEDPSGDPVITSTGNEGYCTWCGRPFAAPNRPVGQINKVVATPTATTATLEIPLYRSYNQSPQAVKITGVTSNAGVEDLTVNNGTSAAQDAIGFYATDSCWLLRVEGIGSNVDIIRLYSSYRSTVRSCKLHDGIPVGSTCGTQYGPGHGYGIWMNPWASANVIEDNIFTGVSAGFEVDGAISGNVIAYNYITGLRYLCGQSNWAREAIGLHGAHPIMNLFEGNWLEDVFIPDFIWGSSSNNTLFRNRSHASTGKTSMVFDIALAANTTYYNAIGNVLGVAGYEANYEEAGVAYPDGTSGIYQLGYWNNTTSNTANYDPRVKSTLLRHGNFDYVTNGVVWNGSDDHTLPNSLYLTAKPSWWGSKAWPSIGPDVTGYAMSIPARDRALGLVTAKRPSAPHLLSIQ